MCVCVCVLLHIYICAITTYMIDYLCKNRMLN